MLTVVILQHLLSSHKAKLNASERTKEKVENILSVIYCPLGDTNPKAKPTERINTTGMEITRSKSDGHCSKNSGCIRLLSELDVATEGELSRRALMIPYSSLLQRASPPSSLVVDVTTLCREMNVPNDYMIRLRIKGALFQATDI